MCDNKKIRNVIHLHLKSSGEDFYYGNLKSLFDCQEHEMNDGSLGVRYKYLVNYKFDKPYENELVVINKGELVTSKKPEWDRNHTLNKKS